MLEGNDPRETRNGGGLDVFLMKEFDGISERILKTSTTQAFSYWGDLCFFLLWQGL